MKINQIDKKKLRIRNSLKRSNKKNRLRLSAKNISVQIIDDTMHKTLVSASSVEKNIKGMKKMKKANLSLIVAETLAKRATEKKISEVYFDRGNYKYHGRIKLLAETLRKNGLKF